VQLSQRPNSSSADALEYQIAGFHECEEDCCYNDSNGCLAQNGVSGIGVEGYDREIGCDGGEAYSEWVCRTFSPPHRCLVRGLNSVRSILRS